MQTHEILMKSGRRDVLRAMMAVKRSGHTVGPLVSRMKNLCAENGLTLEEVTVLEKEAQQSVQTKRQRT